MYLNNKHLEERFHGRF